MDRVRAAHGQQLPPTSCPDIGPERKRKRGRPKETRRRTVEKERMAMGFNSWVEAGLAAANRVSWRSMISCLFSIQREGTDDDDFDSKNNTKVNKC